MEHKYLFITENNKLYVFLFISILIHLSVLFFFIENINVKKLFYVKLNNSITAISVENFNIVTSDNGELSRRNNSDGIKQTGAKTHILKGINNPAPEYPSLALRWGYEGVVKLKLNITGNGMVYMVKVIKSSGYKILDNEAVKTAYRWRFEKSDKNVTVEKEIVFKIEKAP